MDIRIKQIDNRITEINSEMDSLNTEKNELMKKRSILIEESDMDYQIKYRWTDTKCFPQLWECEIYITCNGTEDILGKYSLHEPYPKDADLYRLPDGMMSWMITNKIRIPEKYHNDFRMIWKQAYDEKQRLEVIYNAKMQEESKIFENTLRDSAAIQEIGTDALKKFYFVLANTYHPDNTGGDTEMMKLVNKLKRIWGV